MTFVSELISSIKQFSFSDLSLFDVVILSIIALSAVFGLVRGFIKSFISFAGWIIAAVLSVKFGYKFQHLFEKYASSEASTALALSQAFVFICSAVALAVLNYFLRILLAPICGSFIDRMIGTLLGFARGVALCVALFCALCIAFPAIVITSPDSNTEEIPSWIRRAKTLWPLNRSAQWMRSIFLSTEQKMVQPVEPSPISKTTEVQNLLQELPTEILDSIGDSDILAMANPKSDSAKRSALLNQVKDSVESSTTMDQATKERLSSRLRDLIKDDA